MKGIHALTLCPSHSTCRYLLQIISYVCTKTYTQLFIAFSLMVSKNWKQFKFPSADGWIKQIIVLEYYAAIQMNRFTYSNNFKNVEKNHVE